MSGETLWEKGWEGHETAQKNRLADLPLSVKLEWLEDAQKLLGHIEQARVRKGHPAPAPAPAAPRNQKFPK